MPSRSSLPECPSCFGRLFPMSVCRSCDTVSVRDDLEEIGGLLLCEDCGAENPTYFVCTGCNARLPYSDVVKSVGPRCSACGSPLAHGADTCASCGALVGVESVTPVRSKRTVRGDYGEDDVAEVSRILNVGRQRAEALCRAGFRDIRKLQRASEGAIARVPGIGLRAAVQIKGALESTPIDGGTREGEEPWSEECECPLCGVVTSALSTRCFGCGASFEVDVEGAPSGADEEVRSLLAFYDVRLLENAGDPALHFARAVFLLATGRTADALSALDRVLELQPADPKAIQAKARVLAAAKGFGIAAQILREAAQSLAAGIPPVPGATEVRENESDSALEFDLCPECGNRRPWGATSCPACGHEPTDRPTVVEPDPPPQTGPSLKAEDLFAELQRAVAGEEKSPPPPLKPKVSEAVIAGKRVMLAFLVRIPGVSRRAAEAVAGFFQDLYQVRLADVADLADIPGVAPAEARLIATAVEDFLATEPEVPGAPQPTSPPRTPRKRPATFEPNVRQAFGAEPSSQKPAPVRRFATAAVPSHRPVGLEARRGLVNGGGLVNGRGRVNGLVNGLGYINGVVISELPLPRGNLLSRHLAIATALLVTFTIAAAFVETPVPSLGITIDGNFDDWARQGIPEYPGGTRSANPNVEIAGTSLFVAPSSVFLRVRVTGTTIFADPTEWDTAYAFLDIDGVNGTGYDLDDLGAEYAVRVSGSAGRVEDARLLRYDGSGRARDDWSGFVAASEVAAAATANQVEVSVPSGALQDFSEATLRVLFATDDNEGETSHTLVPVGSAAGALLVEQAPMTTVLSGGGQPFLTLTFRSLGNQPFVVEQVTIATQGNPILSGVPGGFTVAAGATETRTVNVDPAGALQGTLVTAAVAGVQVQPLRPYAVVGPPARAYVGQLPPGKVIDGLFGDWPSAVGDTDTATPRRRALNILGRDGNVSGNRVSLYGQFEGVVLEGGHAPGKPTKPRPPESGNGSQSAPGGPLPVVVGLDYVRFYLATDSATPGGYDVGGVSADRLLEVRGRNGRVRDASTFRFTGASWVRESALDVGVGADRIEVGATLVAASFNGTRFAVVSADWSGVGDVADAAGTRGADDAGTRAGRNPPVVLDVSGNGVFFLRDTNHGTETACTYNKVGSWTKGAGPVRSINLNSGETACWYIDQTRGVTIPTGTWETLLDLSSSGSPAYSVSVQIWNLGPNTVAETVVACNDQTTFGDDVRCFLDSVPQKNLGGSQVVRILLAYASGSGTVTIEYDDPDTTGDSRVTLPIPEFEGLAGALVTAVALVFALNYRRNRRRAVPHPHRPFAKILLA